MSYSRKKIISLTQNSHIYSDKRKVERYPIGLNEQGEILLHMKNDLSKVLISQKECDTAFIHSK